MHDQDDRDRPCRARAVCEQGGLRVGPAIYRVTARVSTRWLIVFQRHCERSEAIHGTTRGVMDCFVAALLAMTVGRRHGRSACSTKSTTCLRRARRAAKLERSLPKIAESVGVLEK